MSCNFSCTVVKKFAANCKLANAPQCEALTYGFDLPEKTQVISIGKDTIDKFGPIDILVDNAGIGILGPVKSQSMQQIELINATNYCGRIWRFDSIVRNESGHLANLASFAASFGIPGVVFSVLQYMQCSLSKTHFIMSRTVSPLVEGTNFYYHRSFEGRIPKYTRIVFDLKSVSNTRGNEFSVGFFFF